MASTSGTYAYSPAVIDLVNASLRLMQVVGSEETATGDQLQGTLDAMAAMISAWQASGIHLWCEEEVILFLNPSQIQYSLGAGSVDHACQYQQFNFTSLPNGAASGAGSIVVQSQAGINDGDQIGIQLTSGQNFWTTVVGIPVGTTVILASVLPAAAAVNAYVFDYPLPLARPLKVMGGRRFTYNGKLDIPMMMWARLDYAAQPNKFTTGIPTAFFFDPQTGGQGTYSNALAQMNVWPAPTDNTNGMRFTAQRPIQDISALNQIPDFPKEWMAAIKWNLAAEIGPEYGAPSEQIALIEKRAAYWLNMAASWDKEPEGLRFGVAMRSGFRRG